MCTDADMHARVDAHAHGLVLPQGWKLTQDRPETHGHLSGGGMEADSGPARGSQAPVRTPLLRGSIYHQVPPGTMFSSCSTPRRLVPCGQERTRTLLSAPWKGQLLV